jgi:tetratricopeptide (TPR) repeat protein
MAGNQRPSRAARIIPIVLVIAALAVGGWYWLTRRNAGPQPGSPEYETATRAFYHGLAALEVGLLDDAREQFSRATRAAPAEPASWANLGLTELRRGEIEPAAAAVDEALRLAPGHADVLMLASRLASARGQVEEGVALLRRAMGADPTSLRIRFALVEEIERAGQAEGTELIGLLDDLVAQAPTNLALVVERARVAAQRQDADRAADSVMKLEALAGGWPPLAAEQLNGLRRAVNAGQWTDAVRSAALLRNVLARVPAFSESLGQVRTPAELVAPPLTAYVTMTAPRARPAPPDAGLAFTAERTASPGRPIVLFQSNSPTPALLVAEDGGLRAVGAGDALATWTVGQAEAVSVLDWNHDFLPDVALGGAGGVRLLLQGADGRFNDSTPPDGMDGAMVTALWPADVEMDGDLDLVAGVAGAPVRVLRNNGDGTWRGTDAFAAFTDARVFAWADLDGDADPDGAFLDGGGTLRVALNRQAGSFAAEPAVSGAGPAVALAVADLDADGTFELLTLGRDGTLRATTRRGTEWQARTVATWPDADTLDPATASLVAADLDNNGALDVAASNGRTTRVWLGGESGVLQITPAPVDGRVVLAADLDGNGVLDLVGTANGQVSRWLGRAPAGYRAKEVRVRAQQNAGDQRINTFALGGDIEIRAGLLWQKQPIASAAPLHFGLGTATAIDVARVVWPNGIPQAEFGVALDGPLVAEQRLKGSCPWVFAHDGREVAFVTDFLWRSPLGLRINAQDTAGVTQTEDWIRIAGDQLAPVDGTYDIRITAELWETHFFDHVSLLAVDHPAGTETLVDERFSAAKAPRLEAQLVRGLAPVTRAADETGRDVTAIVAARDGRSLASFAKGSYQGIAREHAVEFDVPAGLGRRVLVATGWVYPTDSSINVAIAQGSAVRPAGVALDGLFGDRWRTVDPDLGFPAGKNKTLIVDLAGAAGASRLRLRTNLEVYWDYLAVGERLTDEPRVTRIQASSAALRFRGFSRTTSPRGDAPETPSYAALAGVSQRWRDLEGYYTRFGDVKELLTQVDDRYVIMNAGDELRLLFPEQPPPRDGWRRDFVLVGDGWEKDGDYNTGHSSTVLPLPSHDTPDYGAGPAPSSLEEDPVYRRHPEDWVRFHTRYVTPRAFLAGLRPESSARR